MDNQQHEPVTAGATTQGTILCIDDEACVLHSLRRLFQHCGVTVLLAANAADGVRMVQENAVDLVICDMRMPGGDGYDALQEIRNASPRTLRVVLSGYADKQTVLKTVLDGTACVYIQKPWQNEELKELILRLLSIRHTLDRDGLRDLFNRIGGLPPTPGMHTRIRSMIAHDRQAAEIARMIELEPAYAAQILHVANSAIHGVPIGSVQQAVVFLGLNAISNIVLTCELFTGGHADRHGLYGVETLWVHSNLTNLAANLLYRKLHGKAMTDTFASAGLLHDIGKFLIIHYFPRACWQIEELMTQEPDLDLCAAEQRILGTDHAEIGGLMMDLWNLPMPVVEGCLFHHTPHDNRIINRAWLGLLNAANALAWVAQGTERKLPTAADLAEIGLTPDIFTDNDLLAMLDISRFSLTHLQ